MDSIQAIKSRLEAVKNIGQITKAMEVVSATKMRRAQELALNSRPYALAALEILTRLDSVKLARLSSNTTYSSQLTTPRPVKTTLLTLISSDRGLAGSFNAQIFRAADNFLASRPTTDINIVTVGKKAAVWAEKKNLNLTEKFSGWGDYGTPEEAEPLSRLLIDSFVSGRWDEVITISTHFRTTLKQEPLQRQILPVDFKKIAETAAEIIPERGRYAQSAALSTNQATAVDYILEPTPQKLIDALIPHLVKMQIYHLVLEANASEHSARMVAMKNASDNAQELSGELQLEHNKARQANITKELIEIISTQNAL
ncbi:MAG: ATP synthase F1 subunit gamma [Parcubacteria group bacterium]|nr:ATP synthase F1 subunit gamma [Parcubacteria group bacterium]